MRRGGPTADLREDLLTRIDSGGIGKGRYAQRLAARVQDIDLPARIREHLHIPDDRPVR